MCSAVLRHRFHRCQPVLWTLVALGAAAFIAAACGGGSRAEVAVRASDPASGVQGDVIAAAPSGESRTQSDGRPPLLHFEGWAAAVGSTLRGVDVSDAEWETEVWIQFDCLDGACGGTIEVSGVIPRIPFALLDEGYEWTWDEGTFPVASGRIFGCFSRVPHAISRTGTLHVSAIDALGPTQIKLDWSRIWSLAEAGRPQFGRCEPSVRVTFQGGFTRLSP